VGIYEVVLRGELFAQRTINRWNYVSTGDPGTSIPSFGLFLAMGWEATAGALDTPSVAGYIQALVSSAFHFRAVQVKNVYDPTDFYEAFYVDDPVGGSGGECNSPFVAYGLVSNQVSLAIAKGHKRLAGVDEALVGAGGVLISAGQDALEDIAVAMGAILNSIEGGGDVDFSPTIIQKEKRPTDADPTRDAYYYYATEAEQLDHAAIGVSWAGVDTVRSQTSRQYGRGI
jgi:hypothetical protein